MLLEAKEFQNKREFARMELMSYRSASSVTVGILGLGDIGQGVGKMLRGAGYKVLGFKQAANLAFRANSDYIVSVLPSTKATRYLLNEENLQLCRERSHVYQHWPGRRHLGEDADRSSRRRHLVAGGAGRLRAGAAPARQHPLVAPVGASHAPRVRKGVPEKRQLTNFNHFLRGEPLEFTVDWTKGY